MSDSQCSQINAKQATLLVIQKSNLLSIELEKVLYTFKETIFLPHPENKIQAGSRSILVAVSLILGCSSVHSYVSVYLSVYASIDTSGMYI